MADWNAPLPGEADVGDDTHVEDHNQIVDAIREARSNVDTVEAALDGKQNSGSYATTAALSALEARVAALEPDEGD